MDTSGRPAGDEAAAGPGAGPPRRAAAVRARCQMQRAPGTTLHPLAPVCPQATAREVPVAFHDTPAQAMAAAAAAEAEEEEEEEDVATWGGTSL